MGKIKKFFSHDVFSICRMYYHILRRSPKRYDVPISYKRDHVMAWCMPMFMIPVHLCASAIFGSLEVMQWTFIWFPIWGINSLVIGKLEKEGRAIQKEFEKKRREAERMQREHDESVRIAKLMKERARKRAQERAEAERQQAEWEDLLKRYFEEKRRREEYAKQRQHNRQQQNYGYPNQLDKSLSFLGLKRGASKQDAKKSYRRLSKIHHPDMGGNQKDFIELKKHYDYVIERI